jgi:hypothetical protein
MIGNKIIGPIVLSVFLISALSFAETVDQRNENKTEDRISVRSNDKQAAVHRDDQSTPSENLEQRPADQNIPIYIPGKVHGGPVGRISGGSRGSNQYPLLCVLVPDHTALTFKEQPVLYYFVSDIKKYPLELSIIQDTENAIDPIVETRLPSPEAPGIQRINLADFNVRFQEGITYLWHVSIRADPNRRSKDALAWGRVKRIACPKQLHASLSNANQAQIPSIYAGVGIWTEAFEELSSLIENDPGNPMWRQQRHSLLEQVGLRQVADFGKR